MNLPEHRVLEHNRNHDDGELSVQPHGYELPPAIRADLLDPAIWQDGLAKYARGTNLAVALADAAGRLIGEYINPRPTWSLLHARTPPISPPSEGAVGVGCPFSLAPLKPCNCVADALARGGFVVARDRTGLVHFAVPLVLGGHPLGALVAGQVFDQYPEQLPLEQLAKQILLSPGKVWELARLDHPVKQATLEVYADLLATLGETFLQTQYHSLTETDRLAEMTRLRDQAVAENVERKRAEQALRESHARFEVLFDTSPVGMYLVDAELRIRQMSRKARPVFGDIGELIGRDFVEVIHIMWPPARADEIVARFRHTLETGEPYTAPEFSEERYDRKVREYYDWQIHRIALPDGQDGVVCYFIDISERMRLSNELRQYAADLSESDRRKDEFLAMLGHELRNPLAPILNAVQLLQLQRDESGRQQRARTIIERQLGQLVHLVDDLLEVSRISTGRIHLQREQSDMRAIVESGVETVRSLIEQRRHALAVRLPPSPIWIDGDSTRLEQVVVNLLNNAAKYTDEGGQLWLSLQQEGNEAVLQVRDSGVGISPELLPRIFDLFTQAERSLARSQGGLGIGLCLVQRLVEMHGGKVAALSALGQGSEFVVRLPVVLPPVPQPASPPTEKAKPTGSSLRVLVVDDNVDTAESLEMLLRESGHDVRTAHDGPTALEAACDYRPNVVLLDIGLPGLDGFEVAKRMRQQPILQQVVLVAMTGYGTESDRQRSQEAGFDHYLVKPTKFEKVQEILARVSGKLT